MEKATNKGQKLMEIGFQLTFGDVWEEYLKESCEFKQQDEDAVSIMEEFWSSYSMAKGQALINRGGRF